MRRPEFKNPQPGLGIRPRRVFFVGADLVTAGTKVGAGALSALKKREELVGVVIVTGATNT
jgi:hypothetical protein